MIRTCLTLAAGCIATLLILAWTATPPPVIYRDRPETVRDAQYWRDTQTLAMMVPDKMIMEMKR